MAPNTDAAVLETQRAESVVVPGDGVDLHVVAAGDPDGPLVVLLHGFPECWYAWCEQIAPLAAAGYRVLVPDQRGYNLSGKPAGVRAYRRRYCSRDIVALVRSMDRERSHVVGHDWGGLVAWDLARHHPDVVDRLAVCNAPHPAAYRRHLLSNPRQLRRSWYAVAAQLPWLPEQACRYDDFGLLERAIRSTAAPGTYDDEDFEYYRRAWRRPGAVTGMLNWYRAAGRYPPRSGPNRVDAPTLVVWGEGDAALVPELALDSVGHCTNGRLERLPETSHWVPREAPERTATLLVDHLG